MGLVSFGTRWALARGSPCGRWRRGLRGSHRSRSRPQNALEKPARAHNPSSRLDPDWKHPALKPNSARNHVQCWVAPLNYAWDTTLRARMDFLGRVACIKVSGGSCGLHPSQCNLNTKHQKDGNTVGNEVLRGKCPRSASLGIAPKRKPRSHTTPNVLGLELLIDPSNPSGVPPENLTGLDKFRHPTSPTRRRG